MSAAYPGLNRLPAAPDDKPAGQPAAPGQAHIGTGVWRSIGTNSFRSSSRRPDDGYVIGNLAHADEPHLALIRGDEMKMCRAGDGMAHRLVDGTGSFAAMNMDNRNIKMNCRQRSRQHLAAIAQNQTISG